MGNALIARLRHSLLDAGVPIWLSAPAVDLLADGQGGVAGVTVRRGGKLLRVKAGKAVILGSGGFDGR